METEAIVALVGIGVGLAGSILVGAYRVGAKLAELTAAVRPLADMPDRMTRVEVKQEADSRRIDNLENNQTAWFERIGEPVH